MSRNLNLTDRITTTFAAPRPALVCFITAGDGDTAANLDALVEAGADVIELGMPFTDPMADGPAIQAANLRSLGAGTKTADIFRIAADFRNISDDVYVRHDRPCHRAGGHTCSGFTRA